MMSAIDTVRRNKTLLQSMLCGDHRLILTKVHEKDLITERDYNNLKDINKEDVEGHVIKLVDKIMNKGEETCQTFLHLLQTDEDIKTAYPELKNIQLNVTGPLPLPIQATSSNDRDMMPPESKTPKQDDQYQLNSQPNGLCVIINNENQKKAAVKKVAVKKSLKKAAAQKTPVKKAVKKPTAKKTQVKKAVKKPAAKRSKKAAPIKVVKKTPVKKAPAKKAPAKKTAAKKAKK
ncbi:histone H1-I-like isoform X1 [Labrus mixtus]|uniref:histone H1-I-like isoform X1 n=1 Tax=Labrus mixtus TaxID=508554 RepID=UPI0029BFF332|nr:histone H1-I-like isoform X1 [Labrus mixtus]